MTYQCPVCGYNELTKPPENFSICDCCGTEFENDDFDRTHKELRSAWIDRDMPWFSRSTLKPKNWNAYRQLIKAGFGVDLVIHRRMNDDVNFRYDVNKAFSEVSISKQLRTLREREDTRLTQAQLAAKTDMKQSRISELEGMDYSSWSISTLERLAKGLGVAFYYSFITWDELIERIKGISKAFATPLVELNLEPTRALASQYAYGKQNLAPVQKTLVAPKPATTPTVRNTDLVQRQLASAASLSNAPTELASSI